MPTSQVAQFEQILSSLPALPFSTQQYVFCPRDSISATTDSLWRIERGVVRTWTWNQQGQPMTLGYWGAGDIVGQPLSSLNPYRIQCLTSVEVSMVPPTLLYQDLNALVGQFQQTELLLSILHLHPIKERLWQFLVWLSHKFGRDVDQGRLIELLLTHQEMAEALATTRVSVTRMLQVFESEGRLKRHAKQLIITGKGGTAKCSLSNEL